MKTLAQTLGVIVGLLIVGICVAIGFYDRKAQRPEFWDTLDNGSHDR